MAIVNGTPGNDTIVVGPGGTTNGADVVNAGGGHDFVEAGNGNDIVNGGAGNDYIDGGNGDDELNGGSGNDVIFGGRGDDIIDGGAGNDLIDGGKGDDVIDGGAGDDVIDGGNGDDVIAGGAGSDQIDGGAGADDIAGGAGNDIISGGAGDDIIDGGAGDDVIGGGAGDDILSGGAGADRFVITGGGDDIVNGFKIGSDIFDFADAGGDINNITFTVVNNNQVIATGPGIPGGSVTINGQGVGTPAGLNYLVNSSAVCFYPGTLIATPEGPRAIETLKIGDLVLKGDGQAEAVRWVGRQTVSRLFADRLRTLPIRIRAGALGENVPSRDLLVSPNHAMLIEGILVHAGALVNGTSITREANVPMVFTYYNIELAEHAIILAEGAPAESFVDNVDRESFDNWDEHQRLYGHLPGLAEMSLPRAKSHRQLPSAIRQKLAERAAQLGFTAAQVA